MNLIEVELKNHTAILRLNRAEKRNALNPEMIKAILTNLNEMENDDSIKVAIITGNGKAFCAGADLEYLNKLREYSAIDNERDSQSLADFFFGVYNFSKPLIAAVNGPAIAGGCGIATACDFIISAPDAKFGYTETKIGFLPAIVSYLLMKRVSLAKSSQLLLSAEIFNADTALKIGLIDEIEADVLRRAIAIAENISKNSLYSLVQTKKMLKEISNMKEASAKEYLKNLNVISRTSPDFKTGIEQFFNRKGE